MSIQAQVLDALQMLIAAHAFGVAVGALPAENGFSMAVSAGRVLETTLANGCTLALDVALNAKYSNPQTGLDALCGIHEALTALDRLPMGNGWQMIAIRTGGAPGYLGREGGQWLYASTLTVEYTTREIGM